MTDEKKVKIVTIPFEEYLELIEIKGRYKELKEKKENEDKEIQYIPYTPPSLNTPYYQKLNDTTIVCNKGE